jgi:putative ABC transport system permease protein
MVFRGLFRRKWRAAVAVISAALGAAIVVLTFGFIDSLDAMIRLQFDRILRSDYHLTFSKELDRSVADEVRRLPGIVASESVFVVPCTFDARHRSKRGGVIGIAPESQLTSPSDSDGERVPIPDSGLLMAQRLMDQLGLLPGDAVRMVPIKGDREPVVAHVAQGFPSMLGLDVYANETWLNRLVGESSSVSEVRVLARQNRDQRRSFMTTLKAMPNLAGVTDVREQKEALRDQFDGAMRKTAVIMIGFAAVIFFGSILNSTLIAMAERQRELATFSALGYSDRESARLFLRENMITNIAGALIGLPLGYLMLNAMMLGFETDAYSFPAFMRPGSYLYTLALAVVFVLVSQVAVYRGLTRLDRVKALNVQE